MSNSMPNVQNIQKKSCNTYQLRTQRDFDTADAVLAPKK